MLCPDHGEKRILASRSLRYCGNCMTENPSFLEHARNEHERIRKRDGLVPSIPKSGKHVCPDCGNHCRLEEGQVGFCNLRVVEKSNVIRRFGQHAIVSWYFDPLPTNCVADWVCPVTKGDPTFRFSRRLNNLAVFYGSCNSDCLFCQNSSFRGQMASGRPLMTPMELAASANERTSCVCYFGGDPACNPEHSLETSILLNEGKHVRVCYETNGNISGKWLEKIVNIVKTTNGTIKFDLKSITPEIYSALTGVSNEVVLRNFKKLGKAGQKRDGEFLVASVLLVPGYIGANEVHRLAQFIAECDPSIPTALLGFQPHHAMSDLPRTSKAHAEAALKIALEAGLTNVRIGNKHLLSGHNYDFI
jgi:pyruvate formate lyase activating enzyme